jgi:membrane-associated phospholipid phosphatase
MLVLAGIWAGLAVAATAFSRVELGVHWTTDVIASVVFVTMWLTAIGISLGGRLRPDRLADRQASREREETRRQAG